MLRSPLPALRRRFPFVALCLGLASACAPEEPALPDVVLVTIDSARADHVGHLGYELPTAAGLDALRADAALFGATYAPSTTAAASTASLLTGLAPERHGALGAEPVLADEVPTLAETLSAAGWETVAFSHHAGISEAAGFGQGFDRFDGVFGPVESYPDAGELLDWVREWIGQGPPRPFFLYLHAMNAHAPYRVPADRAARLLGRPPSLELQYDDPLVRVVRSGSRPRARVFVTDARRRSLAEQYDTALRYTLDVVGEVTQLLRHAGRYDDALVVVVGNHGEELFDHGGFGHGHTLHEELVRVPLYVKLPGAQGAATQGQTLAQRASTLDVVPTLLDALGLPPQPGDGMSLMPALQGAEGGPAERTLRFRLDEPATQADQRALIQERYKLLDVRSRYDGATGRELYDLILDPTEQRDLAEEAAGIAAQMAEALEAQPRPPSARPSR